MLCDWCRKPYKHTRWNRRFCRTACRVAAYQARHGRPMKTRLEPVPSRRERIAAAVAVLKEVSP
jgi:hypothetical protein